MKIEIEVACVEKLIDIKHALTTAVVYVNNVISMGVNNPHPERRSTEWWSKLQDDVRVAKTLSSLIDSVEKTEFGEQEALK